MFGGLFLDNSRVRGRLKILYYALRSITSWKRWLSYPGQCVICGEESRFYYFNVGFEAYGVDPFDETGFCIHCGSQNRNRAVVLSVLKFFFKGEYKSLASAEVTERQSIYIAAANGAVADAFRSSSNVYLSEYYEGVEPGEYIGGVLCQDLTRLTFGDNSIDLIISEHVMEHVNDPSKAFSEVFRVLKPEGKYIFSVPFEGADRSVMRLTADFVELERKKYHKNPLRNDGSVVFTDFSQSDFIEKYLLPAGLLGQIVLMEDKLHGVRQSSVVIATKPTT